MLIKKISRVQQLINLMKRPEGAGNDELNRIMFRYGAAVHNLRRDGHHIQTVQIKKGYFKYYMVD